MIKESTAEITEILDSIRKRWSPRAFSDKPVHQDLLLKVFEAARWAPSSYNSQPWRFIVAEKSRTDIYQKMLEGLAEFNRSWADSAPVLILTLARKTFDHIPDQNRHSWHDVGLATENLLLQATSLGFSTHVMAGFSGTRMRGAFGIPEEYDTVAVIALGYPGHPDDLPEELRKLERAPRVRKSLNQLVFSEAWGVPLFQD